MRRLLTIIVSALTAGMLVAAPGAWADGGSYPSQAPEIVPGSTVSGGATTVDGEGEEPEAAGHAGVQYYRVTMGFGDHLIVDTTNVTGSQTETCVMAPTVTDYTVSNANCLTYNLTGSTEKAELQYVSPGAGDYLLVLNARYTGGGSWAYTATVNVLHGTQTSLNGPTSGRRGHRIKLTGQFTPAVSTSVAVQLKVNGHWTTIAQKNTTSSGAFKAHYIPSSRGLYKFRAVFGGGGGYIASKSSKVKVRVL